jgi:hypothetical protein
MRSSFRRETEETAPESVSHESTGGRLKILL